VARATNDVIWDWDAEHGTIVWNDALQTMFGYAPDQIANSIRRLAGDLSLQHKLGRNARQTILEHFSLERQVTCFVYEYASAVS
jgi:PAS domain-containing protein